MDNRTIREKIDQKQIGGSHYKKMPIQVMEFCQRNRLTWAQSSVIKYVARHEHKGGLEDIKKAIHCLKMLAYYDYGVDLDAEIEEDNTEVSTEQVESDAIVKSFDSHTIRGDRCDTDLMDSFQGFLNSRHE